MLDQDEQIRRAMDEGRREDIDSRKLKRKIIYVYEDEKGSEPKSSTL